MEPVRVDSIDGLRELIGKELGPTEWVEITQEDVDRFADVSRDHQWIHVDPERATREGPFGGTIAHGALTLSLCMTFLTEVVQVDGVSYVANGGFDKVRFKAPVRAGSRLRGVVTLLQSRRMPSGARIVARTTAEIEGESRPACVADQVLALYTG